MTNTGIFATAEELAGIKELLRKAQTTPVIALSSRDALAGNDFSSRAWRRVEEKVHEVALSHSLPEIRGFYGMTVEGEFVEP